MLDQGTLVACLNDEPTGSAPFEHARTRTQSPRALGPFRRPWTPAPRNGKPTMRLSFLRLAGGLVPLVSLLAVSGLVVSGSKTAPADSVAAAPPPPPAQVAEEPVPVAEPPPPAPVEFVPPTLQPIHFAYNEHRITPDARITLQNVAVVMKEHPDWNLVLEGHCDDRGTSEYNVALGESRARAARSYLVSLGVSEERVETVSYGEERPIDRAETEAAWAKNRRAEFHSQGPQ